MNMNTSSRLASANLTDEELQQQQLEQAQRDEEAADGEEAYNGTYNLFSTESNKHTYSFEKQYYTRSIEFSDYLRTAVWEMRDEPIVIYFLNESSKEALDDTLSAAMPIWFDKVPTAVAGVVYDAPKLKELVFNEVTPFAECDANSNMDDPLSCISICNNKNQAGYNFTCYLIDEHGIVVLTNSDVSSSSSTAAMPTVDHKVGQPLYKINPWLMMHLELDGLYDLIIQGWKLQDCTKPPITPNAGVSGVASTLRFVARLLRQVANLAVMMWTGSVSVYAQQQATTTTTTTTTPSVPTTTTTTATMTREISDHEWRIRNSNCFHFGIYYFNISKWKETDASEIKVWCGNDDAAKQQTQRHYLAGHIKHSNLLMVAVENEHDFAACGNIETLSKSRRAYSATADHTSPRHDQGASSIGGSSISSTPASSYGRKDPKASVKKKDYSINRYRKDPDYPCHNYYPNESHVFFCKSTSSSLHRPQLLLLLLLSSFCLVVFLFN